MDDARLRFLLRLIARFSPGDRREELLGDFEELYARRTQSGHKVLPFLDALSTIRPGTSDRSKSLSVPLLASYVRQTIRELRTGRSFGLVNIFGLAVGIAASLLIGLYIHDEWSHDRAIPGAHSIYRVVSDETGANGPDKLAYVHMPLLGALPEGTIGTRYFPYPSLLSTEDGISVQEERFVFADSSFLQVFDFSFVSGDPARALQIPNSLVVTRSSALRWFGSVDVVGRHMTWTGGDSTTELTVTAVIEDPPRRSHIVFDMLGNLDSLLEQESHMNSWYWPPVYTYVRVQDAVEHAAINTTLERLSSDRMPQLGLDRTYSLQPFTDIWLRSNRRSEPVPVGSMLMIQVLLVTAFLILVVACVNFVNLMTAQGMARMREAGVRRALGAHRRQLIHQFLGTTILSSLIAAGLGLLGTAAILPWFSSITGRFLDMAPLLSPESILAYIGIAFLIGLLTGVYPAVMLSRQESPSKASEGALFRRGLIVFQFGIACSLVFASVTMSRQMQLMLSDRVGFDREHVVAVRLRETDNQIRHESLVQALRQDIRITSVTASSGYPGVDGGIHDFQVVLASAPADTMDIDVLTTEPGFTETYGLELLDGRTFSEDRVDDMEAGFIVNQATVRHMGLKEPVGADLTLVFYEHGLVRKTGRIIGVVRDFQYHSLRRETTPILIHVRKESYFNDYISVRLSGRDIPGALAFMESEWAKYNPDRPFEYAFVDDVFDAMYRSDIRLTRMIAMFAGIGLALSALGIFSVAAYTMLRRRREIGIRKVLGASTVRIVRTMSSEYAVLVGVACIVSIPVTAFVLHRWLSGFAERAPIDGSGMALAVLVTIVCGLSAVLFIILRATRENPSSTLRSEQ